MFLKIILFLLINVANSSFASTPLHCEHYWKNSGTLVPSNLRNIGKDVGVSPFQNSIEKTMRSGGSGAYICRLSLSRKNIDNEDYIFIGEVGDASNIILRKTPGSGARVIPPIIHGFSVNPSISPSYRRVVPFFFRTSEIYDADGEYEFVLNYKDIIQPQSGLRSGPPTIESFRGVVKRIITDTPSLTILLFECVCLFVAIGFFTLWRTSDLQYRLLSTLSAAASFFMIFNVTSIPRVFLNPEVAIRLNRVSTMIAAAILITTILSLTKARSPRLVTMILRPFIFFNLVMSIVFLTIETSRPQFGSIYKFATVVDYVILPLFILALSLRKIIVPKYSLHHTYGVVTICLFISSVSLRDVIANFFFGEYSGLFIIHYILFPVSLFYIFSAKNRSINSERILNDSLSSLTQSAVRAVNIDADRIGILDDFAFSVGSLLGSERTSLLEFDSGAFKFLGKHGDFIKPEGFQPIKYGTPLHEAFVSRSFILKYNEKRLENSSSRKSPYTDILILIFCSGDEPVSAACFTNFSHGYISSFTEDRISEIHRVFESVFLLLRSERKNIRKDKLLAISKSRVFPLRQETEDNFLKRYEDNFNSDRFVFILGDIVNSSSLRKMYGDSFDTTVTTFLEKVVHEYRHLGFIIDLVKGDEIQFYFPFLDEPNPAREAVRRSLQIAELITGENSMLTQHSANSLGIGITVKCALSMSSERKSNQAMKIFQYIADSNIDLASRIVSNVANPGECIVTQDVVCELPESQAMFAPIADTKLKGWRDSVKLCLLDTRKIKKLETG